MPLDIPMPLSALENLARTVGTPFQLYDEALIRGNVQRLFAAFRQHFPSFKQHFAVKALPNPAILKMLTEEGCGLDCSSVAELRLARVVGCDPAHVCFTSNYTSRADLKEAAEQGVTINLDDISLVDDLAEVCEGQKTPELVSFRLNPGVGRTDSSTASNVLGGPGAKFGVAHFQIVDAYRRAQERGARRFGIHMMTGSCVLSDAYWEESLGRMFDTVATLRKELGIEFEFVNVGGGLGIPYRPGTPQVDVEALALKMRRVVDAKMEEHGMPEPCLHMENGRYVTGPMGWLVSRCHVVKETYAKYYGLDACMANLMRPGMYGSYHHITVPAREGTEGACAAAAARESGGANDQKNDGRIVANVVGTLCENNDWFAKDRSLPAGTAKGDLFVLHDTGAHSHSMGFQYNAKLRAPELLQRSDGEVHIIRERETVADYFGKYVIPKDLAHGDASGGIDVGTKIADNQ